jgi:exonuclease VII large subunit
MCKDCYLKTRATERTNKNRAWRLANPERAAAIRAREADKMKRWRKENPEKAYAYQRAWAHANRERLAIQRRENRSQRREQLNARARQYEKLAKERDPLRVAVFHMFHAAKHRAEKHGLPFSISKSDIVIPKFCPVLPWIKLCPAKNKNQKDSSPSLDRLIPELGYVPGNVLVISWRANDLKKNGALKEFEAIVSFVRELLARE